LLDGVVLGVASLVLLDALLSPEAGFDSVEAVFSELGGFSSLLPLVDPPEGLLWSVA
jgi:hypothetical protein